MHIKISNHNESYAVCYSFHIKKYLSVILLLLTWRAVMSQFPNPDFENFTLCPTALSQFTGYVNIWSNYNFPSTLDYHNTCGFTGTSALMGGPSSGNGSVGLWTMPDGSGCIADAYVEIMQANLLQTLNANQEYCITVDLRVDNVGTASGPPNNCLDFGFYFYNTSSPPSTSNAPCSSPVTPQISVSQGSILWGTYSTFSFTYTATGNENAVIIGSFKNVNTAACTSSDKVYLNMDNLSIAQCNCQQYSITTSQNNILCNGDCSGDATVTVTNPNPPYTYQWDSNAGNQTTQNATGLCAGTYFVTITDSTGCDTITSVTLTESPALLTSFTDTMMVSCNGMNDGYATVTPSGGISPYTYNWSSGSTDSTATGLGAGVYVVTVSDSSGCDTTATIVITEPAPVSAVISGDSLICSGDSVLLDASASLGSAFLWSTGATTQSIYLQLTSDSTVSLVVSEGPCTDSVSFTVLVAFPPDASVSGSNVLCNNLPVLLTASGGGNYSWSTGSDSSTTSVLPSSDTWYFVTVSNTCGQDVDSLLVSISPGPTADAGNDTTINAGGTAELNGTGGPGWYWSPPDWLSCVICPDPEASPPVTTTYYLTVTDSNGCKAIDSVTVFIDNNCVHVIPNVFSPNGDGHNDYIHILGGGFTLDRFMIYDRWGEKIFETTNPNEKWDGTRNNKTLNPGVYVYYLQGTCLNGEEFNEEGNITLVK